MAFCTNCGSQINENFSFCTHCGTKIGASEPIQVPAYQPQPAPVQQPEPTNDMATQAVFGGAQPQPAPVQQPEQPDDMATQAVFGSAQPQPVKDEEPKGENAPATNDAAKQFNTEAPKPEEVKTPEEKPVTAEKKDKDKTFAVSSTPSYERPPVQTYENQYEVPSGPNPQLPLNTEPYQGKPNKKGEYGVVGAMYYFLMTLLYAIPVVGLIMSIVMSFGGTVNQNKRGFARSVLIFKFIGIVMLFAVLILGIMFKEDIFEFMHNAFAWDIETWSDIFEQF
ncbi:MAG: zinc-ribbon domain-containing protein [Ruminococcaceae bacterium]|nr:zinc-ribbon domain-containing protein [Oscillospiraceae bacterium]